MVKIRKFNIKHYFCILLGSEQWFLETLFRRTRYIVFPNVSLSSSNDLMKSSDDVNRAICLVYDKDIEKFVGIIYSFDILIGIRLEDFYKMNIYGTTVGSEWFWDKWGGEGLGVILTHPFYIVRPFKYLALDELRSIGVTIGEDSLADTEQLIDEVLLNGFALVKIKNVYRLDKALANHYGFVRNKAEIPQQIELARLLFSIGLSLGYNTDIRSPFGSLEKSRYVLDVVWIDKKTDKISHMFKVCSASKAISILKSKFSGGFGHANYWIALYDVDYGEKLLNYISTSLNISLTGKLKVDAIGWKDALEMYMLFNKKFFYKLTN